MKDSIDIEKLRKRSKKTAISITVDSENLDYLKKAMEKKGFKNVPVSSIFDALLKDFVTFLKEKKKGQETKLQDEKAEEISEDDRKKL